MLRSTSYNASGVMTQGIHQYIPPGLKRMFYKNPAAIHASQNGKDPYGFSTNGLVCYLPLFALQNNVGFKSVDAYKHTTTATGAIWKPNLRYFDGTNDKLTIPDTLNAFDITTAITYELWVRETASKTQYGIIGRQDVGELAINGNLLVFYYKNTLAALQIWIATTYDLTAGAWTHLVLTFTFGSEVSPLVYSNTSVQAGAWGTGTGAGVPPASAADLTLPWSPTYAVYGNVDIGEIRLYNRALSAAEVGNNYNCTKWRY